MQSGYLDRLAGSSGKAVVACINSPSSVTVAGDATAVQELEAMAKADNVFARRLRVDTGYLFASHGASRGALPGGAAPVVGRLVFLSAPASSRLLDSIAFSSAVTGDRMTDIREIADPQHWVGSLLKPVQFVDAFTDMVLGDMDPTGSSIDMVVEVGPHTALGGPVKEILAEPEFEGLRIPYYGCLVRQYKCVRQYAITGSKPRS